MLKIEYIDVAKLKPYDKNTRKHEDYDVSQIAKSIEQYGFNDPIGIWGKDNIIVEGHGRLLAAKKLGMAEVPCIRLDNLTDEQRREYAIMHNKTAELSAWDFDLLAAEIPELDFSGFDVDWGLPADEEETEIVEDEAPEVDEESEPITKLGDIWQLGRHKLICGDSTDKATVERLMDGKKADMVFTDPPYNIGYQGISDKRQIMNDKMGDEDFIKFLEKSIPKTDTCYVCCSWQYAHLFKKAMENIGMPPKAMIIWNKVNPAQHLDKYFKQHEIIWYYGKFGGEKTLRGDIWECKRQKNTVHPTMKPIELISMALHDNPNKNIVYDGFGGSGSTLIACEQLNRVCYMCELDPKYCTVILKRYIAIKGSADDVFLIKDGNKIPFNEIDK